MFSQENAFENVICKMLAILSLPQWFKIGDILWKMEYNSMYGYTVLKNF